MHSTTITIAGLFLTLTLASCDPSAGTPTADTQTSVDPSAAPPPAAAAFSEGGTTEGGTTGQRGIEKVVLPSGLAYTVLKEGQGDSPKIGSAVLIHCTGQLANKQEFWNTRTAGVPQRVIINYDQLITGMVDVLLAMKPGERRQLHVPSALGYGDEGYRQVVPPRADLDMDLELVSIEPTEP